MNVVIGRGRRGFGGWRRCVLVLVALAWTSLGAEAQGPAADSVLLLGIRTEPDTVLVGERFRVAVFLRAPNASRVTLTVSAAPDGAYQPVDSVRVYPSGGGDAHRAVATMVLWTTDPAASAPAELTVTSPAGAARTIPIRLRLPAVRAVLPADSTQLRPPKDIVESRRAGLPWAWIAAVAAVLLALTLFWRWRRRRGRSAPSIDARGRALAELDRVRASGLLESDAPAFAAETSVILRRFAAEADPRLGADLTTAELIDRLLETGARAEDVEAIERALAQADLAKFARRPPPRERALQDWEAARRWVDAAGRSTAAEPAGAGR